VPGNQNPNFLTRVRYVGWRVAAIGEKCPFFTLRLEAETTLGPIERSALLSLTPWVPRFLPESLGATPPSDDDRILVVIQMDGGNDGLNTVIPFADAKYAEVRKELRIPEKEIHKLNDEIGLHPSMKGMLELFKEGRMSIVQGVGFPNPNRSHFESMAIWQHARLEAAQHDSIGWLGRAADAWYPKSINGPDSVYVGSESIPVALRGRRSEAISLFEESDLRLDADVAKLALTEKTNDDITSYIQRSLSTTFESARRFADIKSKESTSTIQYPESMLAKKLQLVSRMIRMGGGSRVYYVNQPGYDTHSSQLLAHEQLLREFSQATKAFLDDLGADKLDQQVAVMAFSEFGRRVQENGSAGTDHGIAGPMFFAGSGVRGGIVGAHPSLSDLDDGDLKFAIDFRQVYSTVLAKWLGVSSGVIESHSDCLNLFTT
jgi:uncharacterized protein (DUF1501 family)